MNRRLFFAAGVVLPSIITQSSVAKPNGNCAAAPGYPSLELVFQARVNLDPPVELGSWDEQKHRMIPINEGVVTGPRFEGVVLAGGFDWQNIRASDGVTKILARYALRHIDGTVVSVTNPGIRRGPPDVMARLAHGDRIDPSSYYFRTSPQFEVQPGPHQWLAENTFVCVGKRWPDSVELDYYIVN